MSVGMVRSAHRSYGHGEIDRIMSSGDPLRHLIRSRVALSLWSALRDSSETELLGSRELQWAHHDAELWIAFAFNYEETYGLHHELKQGPSSTFDHHYQGPMKGQRNSVNLVDIAARHGIAAALAEERTFRANAAAVRRKARDPDCHIDYLSSVEAEKTRDGRKRRATN